MDGWREIPECKVGLVDNDMMSSTDLDVFSFRLFSEAEVDMWSFLQVLVLEAVCASDLLHWQ